MEWNSGVPGSREEYDMIRGEEYEVEREWMERERATKYKERRTVDEVSVRYRLELNSRRGGKKGEKEWVCVCWCRGNKDARKFRVKKETSRYYNQEFWSCGECNLWCLDSHFQSLVRKKEAEKDMYSPGKIGHALLQAEILATQQQHSNKKKRKTFTPPSSTAASSSSSPCKKTATFPMCDIRLYCK